MPDDFNVSDEEMDAWLEEWAAVDRAAADYLADRVAGIQESPVDDDDEWLTELAETISPSEEPDEGEIEAVSAVMALQHADWLGLALGVLRRGPGIALDPELVQADIEGLEEVDGEIGDPDGHLGVLEMALPHLCPLWQELGVLDERMGVTERGVWDYRGRSTGSGATDR